MFFLFTTTHVPVPEKYRFPEDKVLIPVLPDTEIIFLEKEGHYSDTDTCSYSGIFDGENASYLSLFNSLDRDYGRNINLKYIRSNIPVCRNKFYRDFRKITNDTFGNYLTRLRVYKIAYLLMNSTMPVEKIAYACGISTLSNYRKIIRRYFGVSPSELRIQSI